jgi:8-oxo-dGTP pyrophosphatase MutT (NUDIX family)
MSTAPRIGPAEIVYRNRYQQIARLHAAFPGVTKEYFVTEFGERVGVVPIRDDAALLVRQYRLIPGALSWEIPGGGLDPGEDLEAAARRECREEAGIAIRTLVPLLNYHLGLDTLWNPTYLYYTDDFEELPHLPAKDEVAERAWVPFDRVRDMIRRGEILDSMSLLALLALPMRLHDAAGAARESWGADLGSRFPERRPCPPSGVMRRHG